MKKKISEVLLCVGVLLLILGAYQVLNKDYQFQKKQYALWTSLYVDSRLDAQTNPYDDLRRVSAESAGSEYRLAQSCKEKIDGYRTKAIVFGVLGSACTIIGGISVLQNKKNSSQQQ